MINTIGPVWDGNEVWVLAAGGATFAAFPEWYATLFSGFYLPLLLILLAPDRARASPSSTATSGPRPRWQLPVGPRDLRRLVRAGAAVGRRLRQHRRAACRSTPTRSSPARLFTLLNPFGLLGGLVTLLLFLTHGAMFVALKTDGDIRHRARRAGGPARRSSPPSLAVGVPGLDPGRRRATRARRCCSCVAALALVGGARWRRPRPRGLGVHRHVRRRSRSRSPGCSWRSSPT